MASSLRRPGPLGRLAALAGLTVVHEFVLHNSGSLFGLSRVPLVRLDDSDQKVALDLAKPEGQAVLRKLADHPLTENGLKAFLKDWSSTGQKIV